MSSSSSKASSSRNKAIVRYNTNESDVNESDGSRTESSTKRQRNKTNDCQQTDDNIDTIASNCVKYLLITEYKKIAVKRIDILKAVLKQIPNRKTIEDIIEKVRTQLLDIFGIELVECPEATNSYILVNKLSAEITKESTDGQTLPDKQLIQSGILTTVLAVIFMSGGTVHEDIIWKFLRKLRLDVDSKNKTIEIENDSNGVTLKKLLTDLWVRQLYLKYQKIPATDPLAHEFQWGFRAEKEFSKMDVLKFVSQMFADGTQPQNWRTQFALAQQHIPSNTEEETIEVIN